MTSILYLQLLTYLFTFKNHNSLIPVLERDKITEFTISRSFFSQRLQVKSKTQSLEQGFSLARKFFMHAVFVPEKIYLKGIYNFLLYRTSREYRPSTFINRKFSCTRGFLKINNIRTHTPQNSLRIHTIYPFGCMYVLICVLYNYLSQIYIPTYLHSIYTKTMRWKCFSVIYSAICNVYSHFQLRSLRPSFLLCIGCLT